MYIVYYTFGSRLADQGHTVIGVEVAQRAIEEFSEEQKVPFTSHPVPAVDGMLFQVLSCKDSRRRKTKHVTPGICHALLMINGMCMFVCDHVNACMCVCIRFGQ